MKTPRSMRFPWLPLGWVLIGAALGSATMAQSRIIESVIAQVNEDYIFLSELLGQENALIHQVNVQVVQEKRNEVLEEMRKNLLDRMIDRKILEQKARDMNIDVESRLEGAIQQIMKENQIPDKTALTQALQQQGLDYDTFQNMIRFQLLQQFVLAQFIRPRLVITQQDLREYYEKHQEDLRQPIQWTFYQLTTEDEETKGILESYLAQGIPPESVRNLPLNPESYVLNHVGPITHNELRQEIRKSVENSSLKTWVGPVSLNPGTLWVWVESKEGGNVPEFDKVRDKIQEKLTNDRIQELQEKTLEDFRKNSYIKIFTSNLPEPYRSYYAEKNGKNESELLRDQ